MSLMRHSTLDYPARDRVAFIQDVYSVIERVDVELVDDEPPVASTTTRLLPNVTILDSVSSSSGISRRTRRLLADGKDDLILTVVTGGKISVSRNGEEPEYLGAGDLYLGLNDRCSEHRLADRPCAVDIKFPRAVLGPAIKDLERASKSKLPPSPECRLLAQYAIALTRDFGDLTPDTASRCASHLLDLAAMTIGAHADAAEIANTRGLRAVRLMAIKADIVANLTRSDLSIGWISARHGISPQYVRSLFNGEGTTFADFVLAERLDLAHRMLADPLRTVQAISAIAYEAGFGDLSHFNKCFRIRFAMTPSEARALSVASGNG